MANESDESKPVIDMGIVGAEQPKKKFPVESLHPIDHLMLILTGRTGCEVNEDAFYSMMEHMVDYEFQKRLCRSLSRVAELPRTR